MALTNWMKANSGERDILLVVDQAEELITMNRDPSIVESFLDPIAKALNDADARCRILFTVRSEFEPQFAQSPLWERWPAARYLVPQMTQDELHRVIEGPAAVRVLRFESEDLVDQLVNDVLQMPGALPLLSFALSKMYENFLGRSSSDRTLGRKDYEALKGGVAGALRLTANQVIDAMDQAHQVTARRVLERLVSLESGEFARRRVPRRELESANLAENGRVDQVIKRLDEERLIVSDEVDAKPHLELAHDALILGWDRLLTWVREDAPLILALRRLTPDAEEWAASPKHKLGLLWTDPARLATVKSLSSATAPGLNRVETDFTVASFRRARWNRFVRSAAGVALALLAAGASWFAYSTEQQRTRSEANRLALAAELASEIDQSLLLAVSSSELQPSFETRTALFSALTRRPYLRRFLHGANGAVGRISILPNQNVLIRSNANSGKLLFWPGNVPSNAKPLEGVADGFGDFLLASNNTRIVVMRGESLEIYDFDAPYESARLIQTLTINGMNDLAGDPQRSNVYLTTSEGELLTIDATTRSRVAGGRLPIDHPTEGRLHVGKGSVLAFQSNEGVWLRLNAMWHRLRGPPPKGYSFVGLQFDDETQQIISVLGVEQGREFD